MSNQDAAGEGERPGTQSQQQQLNAPSKEAKAKCGEAPEEEAKKASGPQKDTELICQLKQVSQQLNNQIGGLPLTKYDQELITDLNNMMDLIQSKKINIENIVTTDKPNQFENIIKAVKRNKNFEKTKYWVPEIPAFKK